MPVSPPNPVPASKRIKILSIRIFRKWPALVWLVMVVFVAYAWQHTSQSQIFQGYIVKDIVNVACLETGQLVSVMVKPGQKVSKGEVLAKLDTDLIDSEWAATRKALVREIQAEYRQYTNALQRMQSDLRDLQLQQARDTAEKEVLAQENQRLETLLQNRLVDADLVARNRAQLAALREAVAIYPGLIAQLENEIDQLLAAQHQLDSGSADTADPDWPDNDPGLLLLKLRKERCTFRAPRDGTVSLVYKTAGDTVAAGETILEFIPDAQGMAVVLLPEKVCHEFSVGQKVYVAGTTDTQIWHNARVMSLAPQLVTVPDRSTPIPNRIIRGRYMVLEFEKATDFLSGESVTMTLEPPSPPADPITEFLQSLF